MRIRRIDLVLGFLVLLVLAGVFVGLKYFADPDRNLVRNEDAEVIDAALLGFFDKSNPWLLDWREGDFVVLDSHCASENGKNFSGELLKVVSASKAKSSNRKYWTELNDLLKQYGSAKESPSRSLDLRALRVDPRILVKDLPGGFHLSPFDHSLFHNRYGEPGDTRVSGKLYPPLFSPDRQAALVKATVGWSIHHADVIFVLQKVGGRWKTVFAQPIYYP